MKRFQALICSVVFGLVGMLVAAALPGEMFEEVGELDVVTLGGFLFAVALTVLLTGVIVSVLAMVLPRLSFKRNGE